jgi:serine/threonine protein kinase/Tfp pilus assembly protein PilF
MRIFRTAMPPPQNRDELLLAAALETPADKRLELLDAMCVGDPSLRQRLETRLAARQKAGPSPPPDASAVAATIKLDLPVAEDEAVGKTIGRYKLLEKVGEGGCGVVYVAEQTEPVRRRVALKVIKLGMDTRQVVARFEAERQALAMMDHPNIAKVLDAGATENGRPFFVMELVRGIKMTDYCDQNNLTTKARLDLFIKVCQAIQHAHQKGIIHRDIKPSNILVTIHDSVAVPKVIDFGIAKATEGRLTDATVYTQLHQFVGTPAYMSPEQAEMSGLDIDTRSDIYSLGVLLYELLTGSTPFDPYLLVVSGIDSMRKTIRELEPVRPSTRLGALKGAELTTTAKRRSTEISKLLHQLKGDLDWIVMKCLEKDRSRRYETANGLAADLKRHLNFEPVVARPPSASYRFQKAFRRNKLAFSAAGLVTLALVLGLVGTAYGLRKAFIARDGETAARLASQREAARAKTAEAQVRARADELKTVSDFQAGMLSQIDVTEAGVKLMKDIRDRFAAALAEAKPPLPEAERVRRTAELETELRSVNATDTAATMIDETIIKPAIATIDKQFTNQPVVDASLRQTLAYLLYRQLGRYDEARPLLERALESRRRVLGEEDPDTLVSIDMMGILLQRQGKLAEAEPYFREALEKRRRVLGKEDPQTLISMSQMGVLLWDQGKLAEAEPYFREALEKMRRVLGEEHPYTLETIANLGTLLWDQGKLAEAEPYYRESVEKYRRLLGEEDGDTLTSIGNLGSLLQAQGKLAEAEPFLREVLEKHRRVLGEEHPYTLIWIDQMASLLLDQGRPAEALTMLAPIADKFRTAFTDSHAFRVARVLTHLGRARAGLAKDSADFALAEASLLEAHGIFVKTPGHMPKDTRDCTQALADFYAVWDKADPGKGHDAKAAEWKAEVEAMNGTAQNPQTNAKK